jgi:F420H(2)-dependent quinone reductase
MLAPLRCSDVAIQTSRPLIPFGLGLIRILVTTTGAKSGKQRYVPLMRVEKAGRYLMVASKGGDPAHPSWYFNVKANPAVAVQDGDRITALVARELDGAERDEWWQLAVSAFPPYAEYQTKTTRLIPVSCWSSSARGRARTTGNRW